MQDFCKTQFIYDIRHFAADGQLLGKETVLNLIPNGGRNYMASTLFGSGTRIDDWYVGVFGAPGYTPARTDDAAFLSANAGELTSHATSRPTFDGLVSGGVWSNASSPVTVVASEAMEVRGAFIASTSAFNSSVGTVLSIVKAPSPKNLEVGESLTITATIGLIT